MRVLMLASDAFGGRGGIAKFNRDLSTALAMYPTCTEVAVLVRTMVDEPDGIPERVRFVRPRPGGRIRYVQACMREVRLGAFGIVVCGHVNLLPLAAWAARRSGAPLVLVLHGIEAWRPPASPITRLAARRATAFVAVSELTKARFLAWAGIDAARGRVIANCIDAAQFGTGPKRRDLIERYQLDGAVVLLTVARLDRTERYKGIDEVIEALPVLSRDMPNVKCLIVGEGGDRPRLEAKARSLSLADRVVFAGYVPESEKADHYRLADAFVMPGRGEGFGIVYLEAMACGTPVVASSADASQEIVTRAHYGVAVDPADRGALVQAIRDASASRERVVPPGLAYFGFDRFVERWHSLLDALV